VKFKYWVYECVVWTSKKYFWIYYFISFTNSYLWYLWIKKYNSHLNIFINFISNSLSVYA